MEGKKLLNYIIVTAATAIFCYQTGVAILKLNSGPTMIMSDVIEIEDPRVRLPVITVCKVKQYPHGEHVNDDLVFDSAAFLNLHWLRNHSDSTFSLGKHLNLSYLEMMTKFSSQPQNYLGFLQRKRKIKSRKTVIQPYGLCFELTDYQPTAMLTAKFQKWNHTQEKYDIFITDSRLKTYLGPEYTSQFGDKIEITFGKDYGFAVKLKIEDLTDPYAYNNCFSDKEKGESFKDCVDRELTTDLLPELGCIPPWLSPNNQCDGIYEKRSNLLQSFLEGGSVYENYTAPNKYRDLNKAQKTCQKPCLKTYIFTEKTSEEMADMTHYFVVLRFKSDVVFNKKVVAYDLFNFVVDVGSSLGLWLGLSILSISNGILQLQL